MLRRIYRTLLDGGFPAREGISRKAFDAYFRKLARLLEGGTGDGTAPGMIVLRSDGASRGNPGKAGIGYVLYDGEMGTLETSGEFIGTTTNNVAEYAALLAGLEAAKKYGAAEIRMETDSRLLSEQVRGAWKIKSPALRPYLRKVHACLASYRKWEIRHIPREENTLADQLANAGIDDHGKDV